METCNFLPRCTMPARSIRSRSSRNRSHSIFSSTRQNAAFTLLELLLVLAILVVIGGIVLPNYIGAQSDANVNSTKTQLHELQQAVQMFQIRMNSLPKSLEELKDGPSDAAKKARWTESIIKEIPKDAWGNEITFTAKGNSYEIRSGGLDGNMNTDDDIIVEG